MSGSIEIPFAIDETVWRCSPDPTEERVTCPNCAGSKVVTMLLGNGDRHALDCASCQVGYGPSRGYINNRRSEWTPRPFLCRRVLIYGSDISYTESEEGAPAYTTASAEDLFRDRDECATACAKKGVEAKARMEEVMLTNLAHTRKRMAWSVHYWRRKASDLRKDLARTEARLNACKERAARKAGE